VIGSGELRSKDLGACAPFAVSIFQSYSLEEALGSSTSTILLS
jgi:hypothetical protein